MKINYTDTTDMSNLLIETESHIRTLERSLASLDAKIIDAEWQQDLVARRVRLVRIIDGNREERDLLISELDRVGHANCEAALRHSNLPVNFWPAS